VNSYFCGEWRPDNSCARPAQGTVEELREPLLRYRVDRNLPAITETNSGNSPIASRLSFLAVGEFGVPIFSPWALTVSYPENYQPYVLPDGSLGNGSPALHEAYTALEKVLPQVLYFASTDKLKIFMSRVPGQPFSDSAVINGSKIKVFGSDNGQLIVIHPSGHEFLLVGFRSGALFHGPAFEWPAIKNVRIQRIAWNGDDWSRDGAASYNVDQSGQNLSLDLDVPQAVLVSW
jgi:hypothetical protein